MKGLADILSELSFEKVKRDALQAAKELFYKPECVERIKNAKTVGEINRALAMGRKSIKD